MEPSCSQCLKIASIDNTIEAPIIATEFVRDPTAPVSGDGAGANEGLRSWAEATLAAKTKTKRKEKIFIVVADDAIAKLSNRESETENSENLWIYGEVVQVVYVECKILRIERVWENL